MSRHEYVTHDYVFNCTAKGCMEAYEETLEGNWDTVAAENARKAGWHIDEDMDAAFSELCPKHRCEIGPSKLDTEADGD